MLSGKGLLLEDSTEDRAVYGKVAIQAVTHDAPGEATYAILICRACDKRFVAQEEYDGWSAVYPILHMSVAEEIHPRIKSLFEEAHLCFAVGAYRGCLLLCRMALEDMQREQGVSGLNELMDKGIISPLLYRQAQEVRLWGNMVTHESLLPEDIQKDDAEQLLVYLEAILDAIYVQPKRLSTFTQKREQLKKEAKPKPPPLA